MTGSGTLLDPYVIWDIDDLQNIELDLTAYYELGQDIDAAKPGWMWTPQIRRPISDLASGGLWDVFPIAPGTHWDKVCEVVPDGDATYILAINDNSWSLFNFTTFNVPAIAERIYLQVNMCVRNPGGAISRIRARIRVNGTDYYSTLENVGTTTYATVPGVFTENPDTGLPWTVDDINGIGPNPLQSFGIHVTDATPDVWVTQVYATVYSSGFDPIGTVANRFEGCFDGKGHIISNLYINRPTEEDVGLFGITAIDNPGTWIRNVGIVGCDITGALSVGALVGFHEWNSSTVTFCYSTGIIKALINGVTLFGGLFGYNGSDVEDCYSECNLVLVSTGSFLNWEIGGLAGLNDGNFTRCHATGNITLTGIASVDQLGGLIGYHNNGSLYQCYAIGDIFIDVDDSVWEVGGLTGLDTGTDPTEECYATGNIEIIANGEVWGVGGFTGYNDISGFRDCYARGNIIVTAVGVWDGDIGGMVGYVNAGLEILRSYSTGSITVAGGTLNNIGGFCGNNNGIITDCFWDTESSGLPTSNGGTGKTTPQMKNYSTFIAVGWAFGTIWGMTPPCNDGYPCLMEVTPNCAWSLTKGGGIPLILELL